jgi:multidrug efflux pump
MAVFIRILLMGGILGRINRANTAGVGISLKPLAERNVSVFEVINRLRPRLARVPGATFFMQPQQDVQIGGRAGNAQFQYTLQGDNLQDLLGWAPVVQQKLRTIPELQDVNSDLQSRALKANLVIDRDTAARLGQRREDTASAGRSPSGKCPDTRRSNSSEITLIGSATVIPAPSKVKAPRRGHVGLRF